MDESQIKQHLQIRLFSALLRTDVLTKHRSMVSSSYFASPTAEACTSTLLRLFDTLNRVPDKNTFFLELSREHPGVLGTRAAAFASQAYKFSQDEIERIYRADLLELVEQAHLQRNLAEALDALQSGDRSEALRRINKSQTTTTALDQGSYLESDPAERYKAGDPQGRGEVLQTGFQSMDSILKGGTARGETHVVFGPRGGGKSRVLNNLAANYAMGGHQVVFISLELKKTAIEARTDSILTGLTFDALCRKSGQRELRLARKRLKASGGGIYIAKFMPFSIEMAQLAAYLRSLDPKPDVVFLDYFELMNFIGLSGMGNVWEDQGRAYALFQAYMEELNCVGWGATQPGKGQVEEIEDMGQAAGSGHKADPLASFWAIHMKKEILASTGRFGLFNVKNRFGPAYCLSKFRVLLNGDCHKMVDEGMLDDDLQDMSEEINEVLNVDGEE